MDLDRPPATFKELLKVCERLAAVGPRHWGVWYVYLPELDRHLYYGRITDLGDSRRKVGFRRSRPWHWDVVCLRCGRGHNKPTWEWGGTPTAYTPTRWISLCFTCLAFWVDLWPAIFPRFKLGIATFQWRLEPGPGSKAESLPSIDRLTWHLRPPFGTLPPLG